MSLIHYLLVYDLHAQRLVSEQAFSDGAVAASAYADLERQHRADQDYEIVLVGADSLETIMKTHGQYFEGQQQGSPYLVSAPA